MAEMPNLEQRLSAIEDELALRRLIHRYHQTSDALDWAGWSETFSKDAVFENQFGPQHGRPEIHDLCKKRFGKAFQAFQHIIVNLDFDIVGDSATGSGNLLFAGVRNKEEPDKYYLAGGRYAWTFRREADG